MIVLESRHDISRRALLKAGGALVVGVAALPKGVLAQAEVAGRGELSGSLTDHPMLDSWIRVGADESVTVFTGKAELGQGIKTALQQVAAEQLKVDFKRIDLLTADTAQTPDEGYTAASHSMEESGTAILHAAAQARRILLDLAAGRLGAPVKALAVEDGVVRGGGAAISYGKLVGGDVLHVRVEPQGPFLKPETYGVIGQSVPRVDIPAKLTGRPAYVQDLVLPGMLHARVVRPSRSGARLDALDAKAVEAMPGVVKVVRDGDYLAVVASGEWRAILAMEALAGAASWSGGDALPAEADIFEHLRGLPSDDRVIFETGSDAASPAGRVIEAEYRRPYQMHGSIGPSCAVGLFEDDKLTVWSHTQGVYPDRDAIAEMLGMDRADVRVIHMEGAGCYGHNGADDAAADAALVARALPGRPVRVQWTREQEHLWEPYGSAMLMSAKATLTDAGEVADWRYELWSTPHVTRPGPAGNLLPARLIAARFSPAAPVNIPQPAGGADRNAVPPYRLPRARVVEHFIPEMPLRVSALRALGAYGNVFALESFVDEIARATGADPVAFRLDRLDDPRAREAVRTAADRFGWNDWQPQPNRGRGFAYARYKNLAAYCAVAFEVAVEPEAPRVGLIRAVAACDSGQAVNPDGIRNQIEGGIVQSASWTLLERVRFGREGVTSAGWSDYPILRFSAVPQSVEVHVIDRPGAPFLGTGEAAQGPTAAAIANAVFDATGRRLREIPFDAERLGEVI